MKVQSIQILRGGAAWMIVIHHFMQQFYNFQPTNVVGDFFSHYGQFGVDIFFVISGFIMAYILSTSEKNSKEFLFNRIIRIVPNYWFWTFVILTMGFFIKELHASQATLQSVLMSLFFIPHDNPSQLLGFYPTLTVGWTLNIEMFFYAIIAFVLLLNLSAKTNLFIIISILLFLPFLYKMSHVELYKIVVGNLRLFEFSFGIVLYLLEKEYKSIFYSKSLLVVAILLASIIFVLDISKELKFIPLAAFVVYIALLFENFLSLNRDNFIIKQWVYFGETSYSTYLVHSIIVWIVFSFLNNINTIFALLFTLLLTLIISHASHKFIELKFSSLLRKKLCH
jgi:exopolysaccharide production protein ExoZ